jgi:cardiolipin synthase A/B
VNCKFFSKTESFYKTLHTSLLGAKKQITLIYFAYDAGIWSEKFNQVLIEKHSQGCKVRIMVDKFGSITENIPNTLESRKMLNSLAEKGIEVVLFGSNSGFGHTLHIKICAIDDGLLLCGGSNIADHYLKWRDVNFSLKGKFGNKFHKIYDYLLLQTSQGSELDKKRIIKIEQEISINHPNVYINREEDFNQTRVAVLDLIKQSKKKLRIITWYFFPDDEIQDALIDCASRGVKIEIINSFNNRVPITNLVGTISKQKLRKQNIDIFDWKKDYLHTKLYWNDQNDILMGSANLDYLSLNKSYEVLIKINDRKIIQQIDHYFDQLISEIND